MNYFHSLVIILVINYKQIIILLNIFFFMQKEETQYCYSVIKTQNLASPSSIVADGSLLVPVMIGAIML